MDYRLIESEILRQRLYRIFHVYDEDYLTTVKLVYIYRWTEKRTDEDAFLILEKLFTNWPRRKKQQRIDDLFRLMQLCELQNKAAPPDAVVPTNNRYVGTQKW